VTQRRGIVLCACALPVVLLAGCGGTRAIPTSLTSTARSAAVTRVAGTSMHHTNRSGAAPARDSHTNARAASLKAAKTSSSPSFSAAGVRSPATSAAQFFSGTASKVIPLVRVPGLSALQWTADGLGGLRISVAGRLVVNAAGRGGRSLVPPGTYRDVKVAATGRWTLRIVAQRPGQAAGPPARRSAPSPRPTQRFTGDGSMRLGNVTVHSASSLVWTATGGRFQLVYGPRSIVVVDSTAPMGSLEVPPGTYRDVRVRAAGRWSVDVGR
jgi:hypothetical protein